MDSNPAGQILELARWAPSGDNSQPWRFAIRSGREIDVYGYDTRASVVYDLDGWASEIAHGILLETIGIASSRFGSRARTALPEASTASMRVYRVTLDDHPDLSEDPLCASIMRRTVQRRPMRPRALTPVQRAALEAASLPYGAIWFESLAERQRVAMLCLRNAAIRLTIPEAYAVHRAVIAWHSSESEDRLPDASLGANPLLLAVMRRTMSSWKRVDRVNRVLGTLLPRLELDYLPGLCSSAYVALIAPTAPDGLADRIAVGRAVQRLWLTATALGLQMQPQYTPLVFARYAREGREFTKHMAARAAAETINRDLEALVGSSSTPLTVWLARIGPARSVGGRSLRHPLSKLLVDVPPPALPAVPPSSI